MITLPCLDECLVWEDSVEGIRTIPATPSPFIDDDEKKLKLGKSGRRSRMSNIGLNVAKASPPQEFTVLNKDSSVLDTHFSDPPCISVDLIIGNYTLHFVHTNLAST